MNKYQKNLLVVLPRLTEMVKEDEDFAEYFAEDLEGLLDSIAGNDGFGTEQQCDPRGDFRSGCNWSLLGKVQE